MTQAIPPSSPLPLPTTAPAGGEPQPASSPSFVSTAAAQGVAPTAATSNVTPATQVAQIVATVQAALADTVNLSPQAQQAVKMEAFNQLIANLVNQIQTHTATVPSQWPTQGVTPPLQTLLNTLLQQATANQPLPQQLVSAQAWPTTLLNAVLQQTTGPQPGVPQPPIAPTPLPTPTTPGATPSTDARPPAPLPVLQTWLVQQGVVQGTDGERAFTLTLRVPVAWAQAQAALGAALPQTGNGTAAAPSGAGAGAALLNALNQGSSNAPGMPTGSLQLPFSGSVQQLNSSAMGLVMQPQVQPDSAAAATAQAMRTSAILQLEFQPLAQAAQSAQTAAALMPAHLLPQDVQAMLQGKGTDPWLLMAQAQADGTNQPKPRKNGNEQAGLCNRAGCQYQGRAVCAQPFCSEMNYLWSIDRAQRSSHL